jgi:hypothetical protein
MSVLRVLAGFAMAAAMTGACILLAVVVMGVSLYIARLVPLTGRRRRSKSQGSNLKSEI